MPHMLSNSLRGKDFGRHLAGSIDCHLLIEIEQEGLILSVVHKPAPLSFLLRYAFADIFMNVVVLLGGLSQESAPTASNTIW